MTPLNITQIVSLIFIIIAFTAIVFIIIKNLKQNCGENEVFDVKLNTCRKICDNKNGYNWSYIDQDCVKCKVGSVWNKDKGMCTNDCGEHGIWDDNTQTCSCEALYSGPKCQMKCENGSVIIDNITNCKCNDGYVNNGKICLKNCKPGWQRNPLDNPECNEVICKFRGGKGLVGKGGKGDGPEAGKAATNYCSGEDCTKDGKPNKNPINTTPAYNLDSKGRCVRVGAKVDANSSDFCKVNGKARCDRNFDAYERKAGFGWEAGCLYDLFDCQGTGRDFYESGTSEKPREQVDPWTGIIGHYVGGGKQGAGTCSYTSSCFVNGNGRNGDVRIWKFFPNNPVLVRKDYNEPKYKCDEKYPEKCQAPWVKATILSMDKGLSALTYTIQITDNDEILKNFPQQFIKDDKSLWFGGPPPEKPPVPYNQCSPGTSDTTCQKLK